MLELEVEEAFLSVELQDLDREEVDLAIDHEHVGICGGFVELGII